MGPSDSCPWPEIMIQNKKNPEPEVQNPEEGAMAWRWLTRETSYMII